MLLTIAREPFLQFLEEIARKSNEIKCLQRFVRIKKGIIVSLNTLREQYLKDNSENRIKKL